VVQLSQLFLRRLCLALGLSGVLICVAASSAFAAAPSVSVTQFSKTVSGVAPAGVTSVTVDLLRNNVNTSGATVRNQVDTFTAPVSSGAWTGSFATHTFSGPNDQVEVNYTGGSVTPNPVTIGAGSFLPSASAVNETTGVQTASIVFLNWSNIDGGFFISFDGKTLSCLDSSVCGGGFSASVNGGAAQTSATGAPLTFSTPVKSTDSVAITLTRGDGFGTSVTATFKAPQLSVEALPQTGATGTYGIVPGSIPNTGLPGCSAYLVLNEVVCSNLVPGTYSVTDASNTQTVTVPAATPTGNTSGSHLQGMFIPSNLGVTIAGLAAGQTVTVTPTGSTTPVTTLTVQKLTVGSATPLGDLLNGANTSVVGGCSAGLFFNDSGPDLCGATGVIGSPNNLAFAGSPYSEQDDTSNGSTNVLIPAIPFASFAPHHGDSIMTPYTVVAFPRYTDPLTAAAADNQVPPSVGQTPVVPSVGSVDPVTFSFAPIGTTTFTSLGNVNTPAGLTLPGALAKGAYDGRFTTQDAAGDFSSFDVQFYVQGPSSAPAPAVPTCTSAAKSTKVQFVRNVASVAKAKPKKHKKAKKHHKKKKKKAKTVTASVSCSSTSAGTRVLLTVSKGATVVATGTGTIASTSTTIKIKGLKKGSYGLQEIYYYSNGQSSEAGHTLKVS
jgi:hypothetical protein